MTVSSSLHLPGGLWRGRESNPRELQPLDGGDQIADRTAIDDQVAEMIGADREFFVYGKDQRGHGHGIHVKVRHQVGISCYGAVAPARETRVEQEDDVSFDRLLFHI